MTHTSTEQPEALKLAYEIGANRIKVQPTETERLRFEKWMAGHCWQVGGVWDGKTYASTTENDPQAMHTRQLFAAWRDCAALRDALEASQARVPLSDELIAKAAHKAYMAGRLSWAGFEKDDRGVYCAPVLSKSHYDLARAVEAAHGITQEKQG